MAQLFAAIEMEITEQKLHHLEPTEHLKERSVFILNSKVFT